MRGSLLRPTRHPRTDAHAGARLRRRLGQLVRHGAEARRRAQALDEQNAGLRTRLTLLCQATSDGLWDMELGQRKLMDPANALLWSDQVRQLIRYADDSPLPSNLASWMALLHPDDLAPTIAAFTAHIRDRSGATPYDVTYRVRCGDGEYRWFRALSRTQRDAAGRAVRLAGALTDITDRRTILGLKRYAEALIASLPTGLMVLDDTLAVLSLNRAFCDIFGLADEREAAGLDVGTIVLASGLREQAAAMLAAGGIRHGIDVDVGPKRLRLAMAGIQLAEGERRLLVMAEDVTAEQRLREEARTHAARYRDQASLLDKARDAIIVRDIEGRVQFWNKGAERLYGWCAEDVLGVQVDAWMARAGVAAADPQDGPMRTALDAGEWSGEIAQRRKDGVPLTVESHWTLVRDDDNRPKCFLVINTDITQRKASDEKIRNLALYDALTGLANRALFTDRLNTALAQARASGQPLALLFMDLNRFKEINDTQGHGIGDQVLINVARRFQAVLREEEILARLAGDEFVVVAERADDRAAMAIAQRLVQAMGDPIATQGHTFAVGLSLGIATFPRDGDGIDDLLKRADIAMYRAKAAGGGYMFYRPDMSVGLLDRMALCQDLGRALNTSCGLELHFQPQVDLATRRLIGAEALLRWHDPQRGWVSPATFIPVAESRGLIGALGKWVLRAACRQIRLWDNAGLRLPGRLWINLAARQLEDPDLIADIRTILLDARVAPSSLALELTESGLMADVERSIGTMATLRADGFQIAIDDFGTGYSSLAYLKRLPADKLKIDMSFVREMLTDRHDHTIVTTIIGMAANLGLDVIAEGVEQRAQAEALQGLGCGEAQGYYFGRPEGADAFARRWLVAAQQVEIT